MAYLKERKNKKGDTVWMVQVFCGYGPDGKQILVSRTSKSPRKKDAQKLAAELLAQHGRGELVTEKGITIGTLLDDLLLDYKVNGKSLDWAKSVCNTNLRPTFGSLRPDKLDTAMLMKYIAKRQEQGRANNTIMGELGMLRHALRMGADCTPPKVGHVCKFPSLQGGKPRQGFFEVEEYRAMLQALPDHLQPVLAFGYHTGCRKSEILNLKWSQVDFARKAVRLLPGETKNKEGRVIPLVPSLLEILAMQRQRRDQYWPSCEWVFFRYETGGQIKSFDVPWAKACRASGLWNEATQRPTRVFHDTRRTAVRNFVRAGTPEVVVMRVSGHRTRNIFDRYNIVSETDLQQAAERLGRYLSDKDQIPVETESSKLVQNLVSDGLVQ